MIGPVEKVYLNIWSDTIITYDGFFIRGLMVDKAETMLAQPISEHWEYIGEL